MPQSDLFINTGTGELVASATNGSIVDMPPLVRGTIQNFRVFLLKPTGSVNPPFTPIPVAGQTIQMVIGFFGAGNYLTDQFTWSASADPGQAFYSATLPLNTPEIATAFAALTGTPTILSDADGNAPTMQVDRIEAGVTTNVLLTDVTIKNALILDGVVASTPGRTLVYAETLRALLLDLTVNSLTINSPLLVHQRRIALQDDGTPTDQIT